MECNLQMNRDPSWDTWILAHWNDTVSTFHSELLEQLFEGNIGTKDRLKRMDLDAAAEKQYAHLQKRKAEYIADQEREARAILERRERNGEQAVLRALHGKVRRKRAKRLRAEASAREMARQRVLGFM